MMGSQHQLRTLEHSPGALSGLTLCEDQLPHVMPVHDMP